MDPNACLSRVLSTSAPLADRVASCADLSAWLRGGGFPPSEAGVDRLAALAADPSTPAALAAAARVASSACPRLVVEVAYFYPTSPKAERSGFRGGWSVEVKRYPSARPDVRTTSYHATLE